MTDKATLKAELLAQLTAALDAARAAHAAAIEGATHAEAKAENAKDTRGLEQSYLARGQAQRVAELEAAVADLTVLKLREFPDGAAIVMTALVTIDEDGTEHHYFLAPHGGGSTLANNTQVVTLSSPLGKALVGKHVDDEVELQLAGKKRTLTIVAVR